MLLSLPQLCCLLLLQVTFVTAWPYEQVLVNTDDGPVQGDVLSLHTGDKVNTFLGVPFAAPPVGALRWQPPQLPAKWTEPFIADSLRSLCVQNTIGVVWLTNPLWRDYSEDCLFVNVYAPNSTAEGPYPVLVWFFGGAFQEGGNIQYPGHFLASKGTVVVVPNYRLNVIGFATTADAAAPGNYGMLDQNFALQWVQRNIAAYGGDPTRVTIFGQSAGGASTGLHLVSTLSRGLFHRAMPISGSELATWSVNPPASHPEDYTKSVAQQNGCPTDDSYAMIACLREIPAEVLDRTSFNCTAGYTCLGMAPVVDNYFLTDLPIELRKAGNVAAVPEIIGITREEASVGLPAVIPETLYRGLNRTEYEAVMRAAVSFFVPILPDSSLEEDLVEALTWYYSPWPHLDDMDANRYQVVQLGTDVGFGFTADYQMKMHTRFGQPVYQYLWPYISDNATVVPDWMGCPHALDVPYVWGYPMLQLNRDVRNQSGVIDGIGYTSVDIAYSDFWMTLITNFAKTGNPTPTPVPSPVGGPAVTWSQFTQDNLYYMYVGNEFVGQKEDYRQQEYAFWHSYLNTKVLNSSWPFPSSASNQFDPFSFHQALNNIRKEMFTGNPLPYPLNEQVYEDDM